MVKIVPDFVPKDYPLDMNDMVPLYIVIHNTGNPSRGANAKMHGEYLRSPAGIAADANWHFSVDDKEIRQHIPLDKNAWHASDGYNGPGNRTGIAIEICENADGDIRKAEQNAADLVAYLVKTISTLKPFPECVKQHHDFARDGKDCPHILRNRPKGWETFLLQCMDALNGKKKEWNPADEIARLIERGIINTSHNPNAMPNWGELATILNRVLDSLGA